LKQFHGKEFYNFYSSSNIIIVDEMKDEMGGEYNMHSRQDVYKILVLEPEGNSPLGRHWHRLELTLKSLSLHGL
jgi:hypothetical protein